MAVGKQIFTIPDEVTKKKILDEMDNLKAVHGVTVPNRAHLHDVECVWRFGSKPDYTLADYEYVIGKTQNHPEGSLEKIVEDLVKTWEMEASHKLDVNEWKTINLEEGMYHLSANGWKLFDKNEAVTAGNYNVLMHGCPKSIWDAEGCSFEESHSFFRNSFRAFPWEVLKVFSPPPVVTFSWRHWANFTGEYKEREGKGELVEMYGIAVVRVNSDLKIEDIKVYYDPNSFVEVLEGKTDPKELHGAKKLIGDVSCPFISKH